MGLSKYQKEYKRFQKYVLKTYFIIENLIYDISRDKTLKNKNTKTILRYLKNLKKRYKKLSDSIDEIYLKNVKEKVKKTKPLNNLLILPLYEDKDIFVDPNFTIYDFDNLPKD